MTIQVLLSRVILSAGDGKVGPYQNLIYEVELMKIEDGPVQGPIEAFTNIDKDNDGYLTMEEVSPTIFTFLFLIFYHLLGKLH